MALDCFVYMGWAIRHWSRERVLPGMVYHGEYMMDIAQRLLCQAKLPRCSTLICIHMYWVLAGAGNSNRFVFKTIHFIRERILVGLSIFLFHKENGFDIAKTYNLIHSSHWFGCKICIHAIFSEPSWREFLLHGNYLTK